VRGALGALSSVCSAPHNCVRSLKGSTSPTVIVGGMRRIVNGPGSGAFSEIETADCGPVQSWLRIQPMKRMNGGKPSSTIDVRSPTTMIGKAA